MEYDKQITTGIPALDDQHRSIFDCFDAFSAKCTESTDSAEVTKIVDFMGDYAKKHFAYEESLQQYNGYPGLAAQREQHQVFLKEIEELKKAIRESGPTKELAIQVKAKLIRWFIQHIKKMDVHFAQFIKAKT